MNFEPTAFSRASVDRPFSHYERCLVELREAFVRDWLNARAEPPLAVPADALAQAPSTAEVPRSWAVTPPEMTKLGLKLKRLVRFADAREHPWTSHLVTRHLGFVHCVEMLFFEVASHLRPWGGSLPPRLDWLVTSAGPPTVLDLGVAYSTAAYSLEEALQDEGIVLNFDYDEVIPRSWSEGLVNAIRWETAASLRLTISKSFGPPRETIDRGYHELRNPFLPLCHLWRSGVVLEGRFDSQPAMLAVNAQRL